MKRIVLLIVAVFCLNIVQAQEKETEIQKDIRELLVLTGSAKVGKQVMAQLISNFKKASPQIPDEFWTEFMKEIDEDEMIKLVIPIYEKFYTHEEIKELKKFYNSPIGKKSIQVLPQLTQESLVVGQKWGRELALRIRAKIQEKGLDK